jgi:hypothetical protein
MTAYDDLMLRALLALEIGRKFLEKPPRGRYFNNYVRLFN